MHATAGVISATASATAYAKLLLAVLSATAYAMLLLVVISATVYVDIFSNLSTTVPARSRSHRH
jgi:hypothetical protein